jgi:hypothetical protein
MRELNERLINEFSRLRDTRNGDLYFIEHGLSNSELTSLFEQISTAVSEHPLTDTWWDDKALPLIVSAVEVGYRYRGAGTDFWPLFEAALGTTISVQSRVRLRDYFCNYSKKFRGVRPPDTVWARAFHLISWPIAHALLPIEFHAQISEILSRLRVRVAELDDENLYKAIRYLTPRPTARFENFLQNDLAVIAISRSLLGEPVELISQNTLDRFKLDLDSNSLAGEKISLAKKIQSTIENEVSEKHSTNPNHIIHGRLRLRKHGAAIRLEAVFANLPPAIVERMRRAIRRINYSPRLWGISERINGELLISGAPFPINLKGNIPDPGQRLLTDLTDVDLEQDLIRVLKSLDLEFRLPKAFAVDKESESARAINGQDISDSRNYWLLYDQESAGSLSRLPRVGQIDGLAIGLVEPHTEQGRKVLRDLGLNLHRHVPVSIAGPAQFDPNALIPEFAIGDWRVVIPRNDVPTGTVVRLAGDEIPLTTEAPVGFTVSKGEQLLEVVNEGGSRQFVFRGVDPKKKSQYPPCRIELVGPDSTVQSLLNGSLRIRIDSLAPIEGLEMRLELVSPDFRRSVTTTINALPQTIGMGDEPWPTLLDETVRDSLARTATVKLSVKVGTLDRKCFELERRIQPFWWEGGGSKRWLNSELGQIAHGVVTLTEALVPPRDLPIDENKVNLLAPLAIDQVTHGISAQYASYCIAPTTLSLAPPPVTKPTFLRRRGSIKDAVGFDQLLESYFRWSLAESQNLNAEIRRRQVAQSIETWLVEASCGNRWLEVESSAISSYSNPWKLLEEYCIRENFGIDTYIEMNDFEIRTIAKLAAREIQKIQPDLWIKNKDLASFEYVELDEAIQIAYQTLSNLYRSQGKQLDANRISECDPGAAPDEWDLTLKSVNEQFYLRDLSAHLYPTGLANSLVQMDYTTMSFSDLCIEYSRFAKNAKRALYGPTPTDSTLETLLAIWLSPARATSGNWSMAADVLITERCLSRASRYMALRWRQNG